MSFMSLEVKAITPKTYQVNSSVPEEKEPGLRPYADFVQIRTLVFCFFPIPFNVFALPLQLPSYRNSDQPSLGHIAGTSPPPSPLLRCVPSVLSREELFRIFFPRRLAPNILYQIVIFPRAMKDYLSTPRVSTYI